MLGPPRRSADPPTKRGRVQIITLPPGGSSLSEGRAGLDRSRRLHSRPRFLTTFENEL